MSEKLILLVSFFSITFGPTGNALSQWVQTDGAQDGDASCFAVVGMNLFVGTTNGVFRSTDNGSNWTLANDSFGQNYIYALTEIDSNSSSPILFAGTPYSAYRSTDTGSSWDIANNGLTKDGIISLAVDGSILFAGSEYDGVYFSTDNGLEWSPTGAVLDVQYVFTFSVSDSNLLVGTEDGVFVSADNGASWNSATNLDGVYIRAFATIGSNIFAGTGGNGIFLSSDKGSSWTLTSAGSSYPDINALAVNDTNIFAGTANGVFLSIDMGKSLTNVSTGLPSNIYIRSLAVIGTYLYAGTGGNGVWRRPLSQMIPTSLVAEQPTLSTAIQTYPNPLTQSTKISFTLPESGSAEVTIVNLLGSEVARLFSGTLSAGEHSFEWDAGQDAAGTYFCALRTINGVQRVAMVVEK